MGNYKVLQGRQANMDTLKGIIKLDELVYPKKYQTILENAVMWYKKNRDIFTFLYDGEELAGYICVMPVEDGLYNDIKSGSVVQDVTIPLEKVLEYHPGVTVRVYIFSIVLHPRYHGSDAVKYLVKGMFENMLALRDEGVVFDRVLADAVSDKGVKLLRSLGFEKIRESNHDSVIYEAAFDHMLENRSQRI